MKKNSSIYISCFLPLGAYLCQSELGDYDASEHGLSIDYLRDFDFAPNQSDDLLEKIMEIHKTTLKVGRSSTLYYYTCIKINNSKRKFNFT